MPATHEVQCMRSAVISKNEIALPATWLYDSPGFDAIAAFDKGSGSGRDNSYPLYEKFRANRSLVSQTSRPKGKEYCVEYAAGSTAGHPAGAD
jgi:hypothetical protein